MYICTCMHVCMYACIFCCAERLIFVYRSKCAGICTFSIPTSNGERKCRRPTSRVYTYKKTRHDARTTVVCVCVCVLYVYPAMSYFTDSGVLSLLRKLQLYLCDVCALYIFLWSDVQSSATPSETEHTEPQCLSAKIATICGRCCFWVAAPRSNNGGCR